MGRSRPTLCSRGRIRTFVEGTKNPSPAWLDDPGPHPKLYRDRLPEMQSSRNNAWPAPGGAGEPRRATEHTQTRRAARTLRRVSDAETVRITLIRRALGQSGGNHRQPLA